MGMTVFLLVAIIGTLFGVPMAVGWMIGPCVRLCIKTHTVWAGFAVLAVWCLLVLAAWCLFLVWFCNTIFRYEWSVWNGRNHTFKHVPVRQ